MSWQAVDPLNVVGLQTTKPPIEFALQKLPGGALVAAIVIRPGRWPAMPAWLRRGERVHVVRGDGEHAGKLRVTPGGAIRVAGSGGPGAQTLLINLPRWAGLIWEGKRASVSFHLDADVLEIDLPTWARAGAGP